MHRLLPIRLANLLDLLKGISAGKIGLFDAGSAAAIASAPDGGYLGCGASSTSWWRSQTLVMSGQHRLPLPGCSNCCAAAPRHQRDPVPHLSVRRVAAGHGSDVSTRSWPGKFLLVYFGYTHCPDICPTTLANVAGALKNLGKRSDRLEPLFITVDPSRDTPAVMKSYLSLFSPRIVGLTGTQAQLDAAAQNYGVQFQRIAPEAGQKDYSMAHTDALYLLYPSGALARVIPGGQSAQQMASEISTYFN